jgi:hypothetical protein
MIKRMIVILGVSAFIMLVTVQVSWLIMILIGTFSYYSNRYIEITIGNKIYLVKVGCLKFQDINSFKVSVLTAIHKLP